MGKRVAYPIWGESMIGSLARSTLTIAGLFVSSSVFAQSAPPAESDRSPIETRAQIEQNIPKQDIPRKTRIELDTKGAITAAPCALSDSNIPVNLTAPTKFERIDGSDLPAELKTLLAGVDSGLLGNQSIAVVCTIRDRINERLARAGYIALAQIPAQQISEGMLRIQVVTARITQVRVVGEPGPFKAQLELAVARIQKIDPLNRRDAIRELLLAGDIPGLDLSLTLSSANGAPGDMIGTLNVVTQRVSVLFNAQNFGSQQLGRWIGSVRGEIYGLTGLSDRTYVSYSTSADLEEVRVLQAGHDFALDSSGLRLGLRGSLAWSRPTIANLDLRSRSIIAGIELSRPLVRTLNETVSASAGFELLEQQAQFFNGNSRTASSLDKIRVFYARVDGDFRVTSGMNEVLRARGSLELRKGADVFGATKINHRVQGGPTRQFGNPQAFVIKGDANLDIHPVGPLHLGLGGFGQWTNQPLLNLEEFAFGNFTRGRGYDPGSSGGDRAYGFTIEPRIELPLPLVRTEISGFYDWVHIENIDPGTAVPNRTFRSVGGGLRFILPQRLVMDLTYAHPLDKIQERDKTRPSDRMLVSFTYKFF
jgi:hemolysin activation/secretion protein